MKHKFYIFLSLIWLTIFNLSAQDVIKPNGYNVFHYADGTVSSEGQMKNGQPVGYWKSYYPDGVLRSEGNRVDNQLDSLWKFYDRRGNIEKIIDYKKGKKSGYFLRYKFTEDSLGGKNILISKELYIDDALNGLSYYYNENGNLDHSSEYKNGEKHGIEKYYDKDGNITAILRYAYGNLLSSETINQYNDKGEKEGIWKSFYPNGQLKSFENYSNGKLDGYKRTYSPVGLITKQEYFKKGEIRKDIEEDIKKSAKIIVKKYEDGTVQSKGAYRGDKPVGIHREYDKDGNITAAYEYDDESVLIGKGLVTKEGKRTGNWELYYPSGKLRAKGAFKAGKRTGKWTFFFEDNVKQQTGSYKNGKPEGHWTWYYPDGSVRRTGFYVNGKEEGKFVEFGVNQDTLSVGKYIYGMKTGKWKTAVNDHIEIGSYEAGKKNGLWEHYYTNNKLQFKGEFKGGYPDGKHIYYYPDGKVKLKANYRMGSPDGLWKKYDALGNLETEYFYKGGELFKIDGKKVKND